MPASEYTGGWIRFARTEVGADRAALCVQGRGGGSSPFRIGDSPCSIEDNE